MFLYTDNVACCESVVANAIGHIYDRAGVSAKDDLLTPL